MTALPTTERVGRPVLHGLPDLRPRAGGAAVPAARESLEARDGTDARPYVFASADYPGAATSLVFDSDGTTAVGAFLFDPASSPATAFTVADGRYRVLTVPGAAESIATGIAGGVIIGVGVTAAGVRRGFVRDVTGFTVVEVPGATTTQAIGVEATGRVVGDFVDAAGVEHGFLLADGDITVIDHPGATSTAATGVNADGDVVGYFADGTSTSRGFLLHAGVFTPIDFPLAARTTVWGISDAGEIAGSYEDAAGVSHGFVGVGGAFSTVDVTGARGTQLTRIRDGLVTGVYTDVLTGQHGLVGS